MLTCPSPSVTNPLGDAFPICGHRVRPGHRASLMLFPPAGEGGVAIPVHVIRGREAGPVMFLSAAIHGDEINGIEIIRRVLRAPALKMLCGTLLAVPVVNVSGYRAGSRYLPERQDLNRHFPGAPDASLAERIAHAFMSEIVARANYGIDLHSAAAHRINLPQIRADLGDEATRQLASRFEVPVVIHAREPPGTLRQAAVAQGVATLLYEGGEALRLDEQVIRTGTRGILNVMHAAGMLPCLPGSEQAHAARSPLYARESLWVRAPAAGGFRPMVSTGMLIARHQVIGVIATLAGGICYVRAPCDGVVVGRTLRSEVEGEAALFNVARITPVARIAETATRALG